MAAWGRALGVVAVGLFMTGCLVTDERTFPEEVSCPPSLVTPSGANHPLNQIVDIVLDEMPVGDDAGVPTSATTTFDLQVRDCNENQELRWQAFLDFNPNFSSQRSLPFADGRLIANGSETRTLQVTLDHAQVAENAPACHKVEVLVSGRFDFGTRTREPLEPGDLGVAVFWLGVKNTASDVVNMEACP